MPIAECGDGAAELVIDLTGTATRAEAPTLTVEPTAGQDLAGALGEMLATGALPELVARLDGIAVGNAHPMVDDRLWLSRGASDILAAAISLIEAVVARFSADALKPTVSVASGASGRRRNITAQYLPHLAKGLVQRRLRRLLHREFYWQTAYRLVEGAGIAELGTISGRGFTVLPDDGARFYADPFLFAWQGDTWLFLEEYPYATGRGVISAARLTPDGTFGTPQVVLEEPHHLSYPQVFAFDGEAWMIPESSGGRELVLYRAASFPVGWRRDTVLLSAVDLNDMTLIRRDGRFWLIGTERRGGSASDTMVVYGARHLRGPWEPHRLNPILVDRRTARPGGSPVERDGRLLLPVQDGTAGYGGGLGLVEVLRIDDDDVSFGPLQPIDTRAWGRGIHTLNRVGMVEVIDSSGGA